MTENRKLNTVMHLSGSTRARNTEGTEASKYETIHASIYRPNRPPPPSLLQGPAGEANNNEEEEEQQRPQKSVRSPEALIHPSSSGMRRFDRIFYVVGYGSSDDEHHAIHGSTFLPSSSAAAPRMSNLLSSFSVLGCFFFRLIF